ncbi:MAG TPA: zf-HC2 domain-containing protein [Bryobacteraceae bacterium]|nr:zf-HC2 domain-containing protein [Bryobacteraceae bacterium]
MTCAELEILLCDYVDGTLRAAERSALESHLAGCSACSELAKDVAGVTAFIETVAPAEPPAELLTRILHVLPNGRPVAEKRSWWKKLFGGWVHGMLQPRYVMGMAMTVLSFSMIAKFAHIEPRQLRPADLDPVKIWASIDDRAHRMWDRSVKYYDNLRLVIEIQSRLKEWTDQDQAQVADASKQPASAVKQNVESGKQKAESSQQAPPSGAQKPEAGSEKKR